MPRLSAPEDGIGVEEQAMANKKFVVKLSGEERSRLTGLISKGKPRSRRAVRAAATTASCLSPALSKSKAGKKENPRLAGRGSA